MNTSDFNLKINGINLHARMSAPDETGELRPIVILVHGLTGSMEEEQLYTIVEAANLTGCYCLCVEMYGHGQSEGEFFEHDINKWADELRQIVDYAEQLEYTSDIILAGHSQGGLVASMVAAQEESDTIKALLLFSPAFNIPYDCNNGNFFGTLFSKDIIPDNVIFWDEFNISGNYIRVAKMVDCNELMRLYDGPVVIFHGDMDDAVSVDYSVQAAKVYKRASLVILEDAGHCYENHLNELKTEVVKAISQIV